MIQRDCKRRILIVTESEIKHVLILEPDRAFAVRLVRALHQIGPFTVSLISTVKEAVLHLMQQRQDLAFIPVTDGKKIVHLLRTVQPDLRLVLLAPTADFELQQTYAGSIQGVLIKPLMAVELPAVLAEALGQPLVHEEEDAAADETSIDTAVLLSALNQAKLGRLVQAIVFARRTRTLAYWGEVNEREAAAVAIFVGRGWGSSARSSRMQFMHLPGRAGDMLLYSHRVLDDDFITLVALPETPIGELRAQAARMAASLKKMLLGKTSPLRPLAEDDGDPDDGRSSYAIVWRPVQPLPSSMVIPLRRALERLATANACVLTHVLVRPELVHVVVTVPPGRDSTWAAYLLKSGSEQTIQQQYGVVAHLWETGFYAAEASDPLTEAELNLFLERSPVNGVH